MTLTIEAARHRRGHSVLRCPSDGSGFKTSLMHAVERYGGRWVHRSDGYVMPTRKAERVFKVLTRWLTMKGTP